MRIENEVKLDYKDVLIRPKRSTLKSRKEVVLLRSYKFRNSGQTWCGIPVMAANMDGVGTFSMAYALDQLRMFTCITKQNTPKGWYNQFGQIDTNHIAVSVGTNEEDYKKTQEVIATCNLNWICIDIANGYSEHFVDFVRKVRSDYPKMNIIAGNVVTADMTQELILAGADVVKIGIGPGSVCTTRIQTGVGYPQLSAVIECADAAHGLGGHIIADGGCTCPGDVAKAFGAGIVNHETGKLQFYGMSSDTAMTKHAGGVASYRSSEGRTVEVDYRGPVEHTVNDLLGGLRSTCAYVGASDLSQLSKCTTFIRCTQQFNSIFVK